MNSATGSDCQLFRDFTIHNIASIEWFVKDNFVYITLYVFICIMSTLYWSHMVSIFNKYMYLLHIHCICDWGTSCVLPVTERGGSPLVSLSDRRGRTCLKCLWNEAINLATKWDN